VKRPNHPTYDQWGTTAISIETWERACAVSQKWADSARVAAARRKRLRRIAVALLIVLILAACAAVLVFVIKP